MEEGDPCRTGAAFDPDGEEGDPRVRCRTLRP